MKLKQIGSNQTELIFNDGTHVLFSYETPVAVSNLDGIVMTYNEPSEVMAPEEAIARLLESAALTCEAKNPSSANPKNNNKATR